MRRAILGFFLFAITANAHVDEAVLIDFEKKCMLCHKAYEKNDLAPPIVAVQQVHMRLADGNMTMATRSIMSFLKTPNTKTALMKPAIELYNLMPKFDLNAAEIENFSQVIIETEFDTPDWFDEHYKSHELEKGMDKK